jgi:DNA translocase FtsK/SpoIIIE-like protein
MIETGSSHPDLIAFLQSLRMRGWRIGVDQFVAVSQVATIVLPRCETPHIDLKLALAPLLCRTPQDQTAFEQAFDEWWSPAQRRDSLPAFEMTEAPPPTRRPRWRWERWIELLFIAGLGILFFNADRLLTLARQSNVIDAPATRVAAYGVMIVAVAVAVLVVVAARRNRSILRNTRFRGTLDERMLWVIGVVSTPSGMQRIARQMRVQQTIESYFLDVDSTVEATVRDLGAFTPVFGQRRATPAYLFLIERDAERDHVASYAAGVVQQLRRMGVHIDAYEFRSDPRMVWTGDSPPMPLEALRERYSADRLVIVVDPAAMIDPVKMQMHAWTDELDGWPNRAVLMPTTPDEWTMRLLEGHGFLTATLGANGLERLADSFSGGGQARIGDDSPASVPRELRVVPWLWRDRRAPEAEKIEQLIHALGRDLTASQFTWLKACAVYPSIQPELTHYLGDALGVKQYDADFVALARLPWFRRGSMPEWLRERLVLEMTRQEEHVVRVALKDLFLSMLREQIDERRLFVLRVAASSSIARGWAWRRLLSDLISTRDDDALHDRVLIDFLRSRRLDRLSVVVPRKISTLLLRARTLRKVRRRNKSESLFALFASSRRGGELIGIVVTALGITLAMSLLSYYPNDQSAFFSSSDTTIRNWIGYYGATVAWIFIAFFGLPSLFFPAAIILIGWLRFWGREVDAPSMRLLGLLLLVTSIPALLDTTVGKIWLRGALIPSGGYLGTEIAGWLGSHVPAGVALTLFIIAAVLGLIQWLQWPRWSR